MDAHKTQGTAAMIVSTFLEYCMQAGMVEEILKKHGYTSHEMDQIKQELQNIADAQMRSAEYHKSMIPK